jgi:hypothetical protein
MWRFKDKVTVYLKAIDAFLDRHPTAESQPLSYIVILHKRGWPWRDWQVRYVEGNTCLVLAKCRLLEDADRWAKGFEWSNSFDRPFVDEWLEWRRRMGRNGQLSSATNRKNTGFPSSSTNTTVFGATGHRIDGNLRVSGYTGRHLGL